MSLNLSSGDDTENPTMPTFSKSKRDGSPHTCKFCHKELWFDLDTHRYYDIGGETFHVDNCPRRKAFFKAEATLRVQGQREKRPDPLDRGDS